MTAPLFGILTLDREPLALSNLPGLLQVWVQDAGGFAAVGLVVYLLYALFGPNRKAAGMSSRMPVTTFMLLCLSAAIICYAIYAACLITQFGRPELPPRPATEAITYVPPIVSWKAQPLFLTLAGFLALLGIGQPFFMDLLKLSFRRIWAIAKLSLIEAYRSQVSIVFVIFLAIFLFPAKWFLKTKPEDELRMTLDVMAFTSTLLLLVPAMILAAFRMPTDIKNQTIYTIVTKPVERFEIVLGRFFGYTTLMSVALLIMTTIGWAYLTFGTTIDAKAAEESQRARVPVRGNLHFESRKGDSRKGTYDGTNVGREFEYRKYVPGNRSTSERAVWLFGTVPNGLISGRDAVPLEFTFDVFKLTKGKEDGGVDVNIRVVAHQCGQKPNATRGVGNWDWADPEAEKQYEAERKQLEEELRKLPNAPRTLADAKPGTDAWKLADKLAEKYGFYEIGTTTVFDYHPGTVVLPSGLIRKAREGSPTGDHRLAVYVKCLTEGQMLGVAPGDLYLIEPEQTFGTNFFKNAFGLWCRATIIIGVCICLSTYLSGVISLLAGLFLYGSAYLSEHLQDVAQGTNTGGGPFESLTRLLRTDLPTAQLDRTAIVKTVEAGDAVYQWAFRRYANMVPDVEGFTWTTYLMEGFNINAEYLVVNLIVLCGYLLPWGVLSFYLIRNREVAA
jgi:hypothetical protein